MIGFVDDAASHVAATTHDMDIDELTSRMKHDAQLWNDLLWTSSRDIEKPKCLFHVTHCDFTMTGAPIPKPGRFGKKTQMQPGDRQSMTHTTDEMQQLSACESHKTLGHWTKPHADNELRVTKLQGKSDHKAKKVEE